VFFSKRDYYYLALSVADTGKDKDLLSWCEYVLSGISGELIKIDALLDSRYLITQILKPAITDAVDRSAITQEEATILNLGLNGDTQSFKSSDLPSKYTARQKTHLIKKLKDAGFIKPTKKGARSYYVNFSRSYLLRGVMKALENKSFIPPLNVKT